MKKILRHPFRDQAALFLFSHAGPIKSNFEKIEPLDSSQRYKRYKISCRIERYRHICPNDTCPHDICPHDICPNTTFVLTRHLSQQDICPNPTSVLSCPVRTSVQT